MDLFKTKITAVDDSKVTTLEKKRVSWNSGLAGKNHPACAVSAEMRVKLSKAVKGKKVSAETRAKMSKASKLRKRELNVTGKSIMTPNGVFPSIMEVSRVAGVTYVRVHYWMKKWPEHYYIIKKNKS
jgi:hypothetical protein